MLTGPAKAGERMERNEIAHLNVWNYVIFLAPTLGVCTTFSQFVGLRAIVMINVKVLCWLS